MASNRLWVGNLPRAFEKEEISSEFDEFGPIKDIWVAYNPPGYAFVEFSTEDDAKAAMDVKNGKWAPGLNCELKIQLSKKSGQQVKKEWEDNHASEEVEEEIKGTERIKIEDITEAIKITDVNSAFEEFGRIVDISIAKDNSSASVEFETVECAARAVEETNGSELFGGIVKVEVIPEKKPARKSAVTTFRKTVKTDDSKAVSSRIFVGNFTRAIEKLELKYAFKHCGTITDVWLAFNPPGFGFLEFETPEEAQKAVTLMNRASTDFSDSLKVEITAKRQREEVTAAKESRLFVGGIKEPVDKASLRPVFEKYGELKDIWVAQDPPGYAFVEFTTHEDAERAVEAVNGMDIFGGPLTVNYTKKKREPYNNKGGFGDRGGLGSRGGRGERRGGRGAGPRGGPTFGRPARSHPYAGDYPPERRLPPMRLPRGLPRPSPAAAAVAVRRPPPSRPAVPPPYYDYFDEHAAAVYPDRHHAEPAAAAPEYPPPAAYPASGYPPAAYTPPAYPAGYSAAAYHGSAYAPPPEYATPSYPPPASAYSDPYYYEQSYLASRPAEYAPPAHSSRSRYYPDF